MYIYIIYSFLSMGYNHHMSKIKSIFAREVLASGGSPSLEVTLTLDSGTVGEASVSYGASVGSHEALTLLDHDLKRFHGQGTLKAVANIHQIIAPALIGLNASDQRHIDQKMLSLDGTDNKSKLGANAILAVSLALARATAADVHLPLYHYLRQAFQINLNTWVLPKPMVVMIEGGKHADHTTDLQEYLVTAQKNLSASDNIRMQIEIYQSLQKILQREHFSTNVGSEGAFAPTGIKDNELPLQFLLEAIQSAGYTPGVDAALSLDAAASEFFRDNHYYLQLNQQTYTGPQLIDLYSGYLKKYPVITIEDMLQEDDWDNWVKLTKVVGGTIVIADDLTATNLTRLQKAIDLKAATAVLIKLNQAGTLTETINCCLLARQYGLMTIPSHRGGGETNDTFLVDLAVAVGSEYIKVGPTRGERVAKWNRLMRIEEELKS